MKLNLKALSMLMAVITSFSALFGTFYVKTVQAGVTFGSLMYGKDVSAWTPNTIECLNEQPSVQNDQEFRYDANEIFYIDFRWHIKKQTSTTVTFVLQTNDTYLGWQTVVFDTSTGIYGYEEQGKPGNEILRTLTIPECGDTGNHYLPKTKDQCKKGNWESYGVFKNQGDCVSYIATKGKNLPANQ